jgi:hypothetical protein
LNAVALDVRHCQPSLQLSSSDFCTAELPLLNALRIQALVQQQDFLKVLDAPGPLHCFHDCCGSPARRLISLAPTLYGSCQPPTTICVSHSREISENVTLSGSFPGFSEAALQSVSERPPDFEWREGWRGKARPLKRAATAAFASRFGCRLVRAATAAFASGFGGRLVRTPGLRVF